MSSRFRSSRPVPPSRDLSGSTSSSSRMLAWLMDDLVRIPGTRFGVGLDVLLGLIPGVGDAAGTVISGVILADAVRHRVPLSVLVLMAWNLIVDAVLGLVPGVGDVADAAHRANVKNLRLLQTAVEQGRTVPTSTTGYLVRAIVLVVVTLAVVIGFALLAIWGLLRLFRMM